MTVLGLILVAGGVALGVGVLVSSTDGAMLTALGVQVNTTVAGIFATGAATMLAVLLGLLLLWLSVRRARRRRAALRMERERRRATEDDLARERAARSQEQSRARVPDDTQVVDVRDPAPTRPGDPAVEAADDAPRPAHSS